MLQYLDKCSIYLRFCYVAYAYINFYLEQRSWFPHEFVLSRASGNLVDIARSGVRMEVLGKLSVRMAVRKCFIDFLSLGFPVFLDAIIPRKIAYWLMSVLCHEFGWLRALFNSVSYV